MAAAPGRIGLLGGSFDPPHQGHLWMARRARTTLDLDEVWFLPASSPPHKDPRRQSPYEHRLAMLGLLLAGEESMRIDESEMDKGGTSYTIDLLRHLKGNHGDALEFVLLIGLDSLADMDSWKDPDALFAEVEVAVLAREGFSTGAERPCRLILGETHPAKSRNIRLQVAAGKEPLWLNPAIREYIERHGLYGVSPAGR